MNLRWKEVRSMAEATILVVDDNPEITEVLEILLRSDGYDILTAHSGERALELFSPEVDLVILDVMLSGISGYKTCEKLREISNVPIIFLTAKTTEQDKSLGLLIGGDDYLAKPFSHSELSARVKALLRRYMVYKGKESEKSGDWMCFDELRVSRDSNQVLRGGEEVNLSQTEYSLLRLLAEHPNKIFSAQNIYESVWNEPYFYTSNSTVMVHIHKLRNKLEDDPQNPRHIITVWGKGYRLA